MQRLATIGNAEALSSLEQVLGSRSFFHPVHLSQLKNEIVRSLEQYPAPSARPVLERLAAGKGILAEQARQSLRKIGGRQP